MAGIYLHIPFCKQACHYCDFHFSTNLSRKDDMVRAIASELALQKNYLLGENISSIYFGGGTPSLLDRAELSLIFEAIHGNFTVDDDAEITLEANPDDLSAENLAAFSKSGINRLSIGIQTFDADQLKFLNRAHNADQARNCVVLAKEAGFKNISIDLIYAIPSPDHTIWKNDLEVALALDPQHISSYSLTIEPKTVFGTWTKTGKMLAIDEEYAATQFEILMSTLEKHGYEQYEISNFCKPGFISRHNSNYWRQAKYLGVGPGAHSYNHILRQSNISNNAFYIKSIANGNIPFEEDYLDNTAKVNEYMMTSLRTKWGCDLDYILQKYGINIKMMHSSYISKLLEAKLVFLSGNLLRLTNSGKLIADKIIEDLFFE